MNVFLPHLLHHILLTQAVLIMFFAAIFGYARDELMMISTFGSEKSYF